MDKKWKKVVSIVLGIFFVSIGIVAIVNTGTRVHYEQVLWLCYSGLILIGIGMLTRNSYLIASQVNVLGIPLLFWSLDFISALVSGRSIFGITDYFFEQGFLLSKLISLQHLFTIPFALFAIYLIKLRRKDTWKFSFAYLTVIFVISRMFTSPDSNVNCVYRSCIHYDFSSYYSLYWFLVFFFIISLTCYLIPRFRIFMAEKRSGTV